MIATQALWFLTRGTGVITLVLLTAVVALGITGRVGWSSERWPRFITQGLHRNLSLLVVAFVGIHVATSVVDGYAPIRWVDALVPFVSAYRPVWLGLGAVAFDLLLALVITSLLRARLGFGAWRAVHWFAYACWPIALLHGLGTGSDTQTVWMLALDALSVAVGARRAPLAPRGGHSRSAFARGRHRLRDHRGHRRRRRLPRGGSAAGRVGADGGNAPGPNGGVAAAGVASGADAPAQTSLPAEAAFSGSARQRAGTDGTIVLDLSGTVAGSVPLVLDIQLQGQEAGGGLAVQGGEVRLGPQDDPSRYQGSIAGIDDGRIQAQLRDAGGASVTLVAALRIAGSSGDVSGTVAFSGTA